MPTRKDFSTAFLFVAVFFGLVWGAILTSDKDKSDRPDLDLLKQCEREFETKGRQEISSECWKGMKGKYRIYFPPPERH